MKQEVLTDILDKIIDYRGKTPKKLGGDWSKSGYRALSALQVKTTGLQNLDECHYVNEDIYRKWMKEEVKRGDILMTSEAPAGQVFYWDSDEKIVLSQRLFCLRVNNKHNPIYVKYYLQSDTGQKAIFGNLSGSTVSGVSAKTLEYTTIFIRSLEEETKIANVLYSIDKKIDINNKIIKTSEKLMREIYDHWFVQFDFPDENGRPYKSFGGEMVYDEKLKREIPKGWKACNILDVADWVGGAQPPKSTFIYEPCNGYVRFIQNRDYADDNYKTWIPESKSNKICDRLDIMMDKYGDAGRIRFGLAGAYNVALAKIAIEKEKLREYIRGFLSSEAIYQYLYNACMASTRASLNEEILGNLNLAIPSEEILSKYQSMAEQNIQLILNLSDENKQLASLRDWLLPMLINGQVTIKE